MTRLRQLQPGFTIVELLIVVVVIAILASITIVSYNGIQSRAAVSAKQANTDSIIKKIALVASTTSNQLSLASSGGTATLSSFELGSMANQIVIDTDDEVILDGGDCTNTAIMTKKKFCLGVNVEATGIYSGHIVYWHDVEGVWKIKTFGINSTTEVNTPGSQVPTSRY
jgi:prepilin-type N-terminal cleavage/methylation domain-containing protein